MELILKFIALLSLPIAFYAAYVARGSRIIANKALILNTQAYTDKQSSFNMYLVKGNFYKDLISDKKIILLNITVHNLSDSKNSFTSILKLEYTLPSGENRRISVEHDPALAEKINNDSIQPFDLNPRLDERDSETKWFCFLEPNNIPDDYRNSKYQIVLKDNKANESTQDLYILKAL